MADRLGDSSHCGLSVGGMRGAALPLVFLPPLLPLVAEQQRLGAHEMRAGQQQIDPQRVRAAVKRLVEFRSVVVDDRLIMQAQQVARAQRGGAAGGLQRLVQAADVR